MSSEPAGNDPPESEGKGLAAVPDPDDVELFIEAGGQIGMKVGGKTADQSTIVFRGGEIKVRGQFEKGQRLKFQIEGPVVEVDFIDLTDHKTGQVTGSKRKHVMTLDGISQVED